MITLHDKATRELFGEITEDDLRFLLKDLERESEPDRDYYIDSATIEMLETDGAPAELVALLRRSLAGRDGIDVVWSGTLARPVELSPVPDVRRVSGPDIASPLVAVFSSGDPVTLAIAKATLDAEGIAYVIQGEGVQDLIGLGRVPSGYNAVSGPARIHVDGAEAERALEALADALEGGDG
ncbi:MAG: hypothetical protein EXR93_12395 [Gemmatimonadetes bacterium]|nr:hypothetical protein [Gemmatimonadota bacterium]